MLFSSKPQIRLIKSKAFNRGSKRCHLKSTVMFALTGRFLKLHQPFFEQAEHKTLRNNKKMYYLTTGNAHWALKNYILILKIAISKWFMKQ